MARTAFVLCLALQVAAGCAKVGDTGTPRDAGRPGDAGGPTPPDATGPVFDYGGFVSDVPNTSCNTSISGTTFAPNGKLPLNKVTVFVPAGPLPPFRQGISCDRCGTIGNSLALTHTISDVKGHFKLNKVPPGKDIPLVVQVGKWRRKVTLPNVVACQDNPITDPELTRLPRNRQEGDMPRIAVATGGCDRLGCLLPQVGVDPNELGIMGQDKAITYYRGFEAGVEFNFGPANMTLASAIWTDEAALSQYDALLLTCECGTYTDDKPAAAFDVMTRYLNKGGRIFGSHYSYMWTTRSSDPAMAGALRETRKGDPLSIGRPTLLMDINTGFAKGKDLADWLQSLHPAAPYAKVTSVQVENNLEILNPAPVEVWTSSASGSPPPAPAISPRILSINTPVGMPVDKQCGRATQLDVHVYDNPGLPMFPGACPSLQDSQEVLAFLFFELFACLVDGQIPVVP